MPFDDREDSILAGELIQGLQQVLRAMTDRHAQGQLIIGLFERGKQT